MATDNHGEQGFAHASATEQVPSSPSPTTSKDGHYPDRPETAQGVLSSDEEKGSGVVTPQHHPADGDNAGADGFVGGQPVAQVLTAEQKEAGALTFPEGGTRAWLVVAGSFFCTLFTWGFINAFGVLENYYLATNLSNYTASDIAWISSLQYCLIFLMGLFTGRLFDAGLFKPVIGFGMLLFVFCQMMVSLSTEYWQLILSQGIGSGIGFGIIFSLAVSVPAHWFHQKRGLAFGFVAAGSSIGGVIFPIMCKRLIPSIGFPWTMRLIGFMALVCFGVAWLGMDTRLPPSIHLENGGWKKVKLITPAAFKNPAYTLFVIGATLVLFGLYTPFTYIDLFTDAYDIPATGYYLSILNAASLFGRTIPGALADRFGRMNTVIPHLYVCGLLIIIFPLCTNLGGMLAFSIIFGFTSGCYVSLLPACVSQLGSTDSVGTRLGMMFAVMSIGGLFGTPISGAILGDAPHYNWWGTFGFAAACVFSGTICIHAARQCALPSFFSLRGKI